MKIKKMVNLAEVGITPAVHLQLIDWGDWYVGHPHLAGDSESQVRSDCTAQQF